MVLRSEDASCLVSDIPESEVRLTSNASPDLEIAGQSKLSKIRSLYGDDLDERDAELSFFQERRYGRNPEVRPNLVVHPSESTIPSFSGNTSNLPVPALLGSRFGWAQLGSDGTRRGEWNERNPRETTWNDGVYFSDQPAHRPIHFLPPRDETVVASEMGQSVRVGREDPQNVTQRDSK